MSAVIDRHGRLDGRVALSIGGIIVCITTVGMTYSLTLPLLALLLEAQGVEGWLIGANAAMTGAATLASAPLVPRLIRRFGVMPFIQGCLLLAATTLIAFPLLPSLAAWFVLRFLMNVAITGLFITSEAWIGHLAGNSHRGRIMGIYATAMAVGHTIGPVVVQVTGIEGIAPFATVALATAAGMLPVNLARRHLPPFDTHGSASLAGIARSAPTPVLAALLAGAIESGMLSLLPVWGVQGGLTELGAARLMIWLGLGNILLQIPIGWASDRVGRHRMLIGCALVGVGGAIGLPLLIGTMAVAPLLVVMGGALMGIYTVGLTLLGQRFSGPDLTTANAAFVIFYGLGALVGPPVGGAALDLAGRLGLPFALGLSCCAFALYALRDLCRKS
ncbi:MFS transporter [Zavarzinia compransoris]|uniref:MFS transporter n=1 Tax=Zavarzinia compransoris TaxID=1264899 RepID=A0A317DYQ8_9PROT|nr:MFS transporter [Zavarzinia compransoris]PWR19819.1 MFS transporter [Zavarzinia compransoris]TDP45076.1 putative MFS family arabinose efflux permease [Zavarzinia compransoris]